MSIKKIDVSGPYVDFIDEMTTYSDAGAILPKVYLYFGQKQVDLSGVTSKDQLLSLTNMDLEFVNNDTEIIVVATKEI